MNGGPAGAVARAFINSKLTPLLMIASLLLGLFAVLQLPREEEPQIVVPMIDVFVSMPGASAREVEERVTRPMEKLLWEIPGVEYIYSTSSPGQSLAIVRFEVGRDEERSIVHLNQKLQANFDRIPPGASLPLVKPRSIDDVPVLALTLWSRSHDGLALRQMAAQLQEVVNQTPDVSAVELIGGQRRTLRVEPDPARLAARGLTPGDVVQAIMAANQKAGAGALREGNRETAAETGSLLRTAGEVSRLAVSARDGRPVTLGEIARVADAAGDPDQYVMHGERGGFFPAVTLSVAKRKGANAIDVTREVLRRVEAQRARILPAGVELTVTRDYGRTAAEKSNELLEHMGIAVIGVSLLVAFTLGFRESLIVFTAIPVTLALTLAVFYFYGYTLNRITLFALIFSIGILVDDAIVVVENIVRHRHLPENAGRSAADVAVEAVAEVGNPTILATLTVIAAILPMGFVGGLMGPYMRPIPVGATAAMAFSLIIAFAVTPYVAIRVFGNRDTHAHEGAESRMTRGYRRWMAWLLERPARSWGFLAVVVGLLLGSMLTVASGWVQVKMLPFDNKSEFQIIVNMPEGTSLEETARVTRRLAEEAFAEPEVVNVQTYAGTAAPFNFNGLVRHYYLRRAAHSADVQVNLLPKHERKRQSHEIAKSMRRRLAPAAEAAGASIQVAEVPPGPPVLQTLVAEIYGPEERRRVEIAAQVKDAMRKAKGVVDVDWYVEDPQPKIGFVVDQEKAALHGIPVAEVARALRLAVSGEVAGLLHAEESKEDVPIEVRLPEAARASAARLAELRLRGRDGGMVSLADLVRERAGVVERSLYRKNLMPVTYVTADVAGEVEAPVYAILDLNPKIGAIPMPEGYRMEIYSGSMPPDASRYDMKWDGEWHITYEVFRDLGIAFAAVLVLIYLLVTGWFESFATPLIIMAAIPFSLVGILPAHGLLSAFFTATSMIGFIAGAGIVVRNSIILVDFVELRLKQGMPLVEAVVDAGAVRFRPMMLTAAAVVVGASIILFDPIFQGLAIALMAGEIASLALSRVTVPIVYYLYQRRSSV
jgi:multidrug efflux pump subunit AcrB